MKNLILIGAGGHAKSCIDVIEQEKKYKIIGLIDLKEKIGQKILGYEVIDSDDNLSNYISDQNYFLVTMGQIKSSKKRTEIFKKLVGLKANIATVISPLSYVSKHSQVGVGTIIMHHALVNSAAQIGQNCIINSKALIEHDAIVKNYCHISTAAVINGNVTIDEGSFVGSNATTNNSIDIAQNSFLKAASLTSHSLIK